jgi:hypothetical protein
LREAGFRLFTLTDNLLHVQTRQLDYGRIVGLFERRFSADSVKHHKPSREAYAYVERELRVAPSDLCLIACHTWDTLGAVAAGWEAALIRRVGNDVLGVGPPSHRSSKGLGRCRESTHRPSTRYTLTGDCPANLYVDPLSVGSQFFELSGDALLSPDDRARF